MRRRPNFSSQIWIIFGILFALFAFLTYQPWWLNFKYRLFNPPTNESLSSLRAENDSLKSEIIQLENFKNFLASNQRNYLPASVFSAYPFNFKNEIILNAGKNEGVIMGAPVIYNGLLIGKIDGIFGGMSSAETIFDSSWQSSVYVGQSGVSALLVGGNYPKITLINKDAQIASGDLVYNADKRFPYGLPIASVGNVGYSSNGIFKEATLKIDYNTEDLRIVSIANDYPRQ